MATQYYTLTGSFKWAKVKEESKDTKYDPGGAYTVDFYPDAPSTDILNKSGLQVEPREDKEGKVYWRLKRPHQKIIKSDLVVFGPPLVQTVKDNVLVKYDGLIGNGSTGAVELVIYDTKLRGKGHRLESITLYNLIEYVPNQENTSPNAIRFTPF